jgi:hypothetical protein
MMGSTQSEQAFDSKPNHAQRQPLHEALGHAGPNADQTGDIGSSRFAGSAKRDLETLQSNNSTLAHLP